MNSPQNVRPRVTVSSPGDVVSILPYYVGFQPTNSVVVVGMVGPRREIGPVLRYDLEAPPSELATDSLAKLAHLDITAAYVAVFCADTDLCADTDAVGHPDAFLERAEVHGVELVDVVVVHDNRWRSVLCDDPQCCSADGNPVPDGSSGVAAQVAAAAALDGTAVLDSREALADAVKAPVALAARAGDLRLGQAVDRMCADVAQKEPDDVHRRVVERVVRDARACAEGAPEADADEAADLIVAVAVSPVIRDDIITHPDAPLAGLADYLSAVARLTPDPYAARICSMVAAIALRRGNGALANVAIERALANDCTDTLALILDDMSRALLPPSVVQEWVETARWTMIHERSAVGQGVMSYPDGA